MPIAAPDSYVVMSSVVLANINEVGVTLTSTLVQTVTIKAHFKR